MAPKPTETADREHPTVKNENGWCFDDLETYRSYADCRSGGDPLAASILCRAVKAECQLERERQRVEAAERERDELRECPLTHAHCAACGCAIRLADGKCGCADNRVHPIATIHRDIISRLRAEVERLRTLLNRAFVHVPHLNESLVSDINAELEK